MSNPYGLLPMGKYTQPIERLRERRERVEELAAKSYVRREGKINLTLPLPVDENLFKFADEAKKRKFDFNQWVRDKLYEYSHEVTDQCGVALPAKDE
jgi:hypothetical protein